ncbi:MAG: peptidoglycan DD-metalloendopeptidase family protein [Ghiorsea sp.]|nr:peptidoglycan DD-metalloendopeptidase family protein [Ghiorsea sp.]
MQARDIQAELQSIQKQKQLVKRAQQTLNKKLGTVGIRLKKLDVQLLAARQAYRQVRQDMVATDQRLQTLAREKKSIQQSMQSLFQQMLKGAKAAYQHGQNPSQNKSVWLDIWSDTSITELPHRQHLLKLALLSQEQDRLAWQTKVDALTAIEKTEQATKNKLVALRQQRKDAEQILVSRIADKKKAAKGLRSDLKKKKAHQNHLTQQEKALQHLLQDLGDTLLASDKQGKIKSIRRQKGKLAWPIQGRVVVAFGQKTSTGVQLAGVHIAPAKRSEKGKLVHALGQGQVRYADWFGGYGLMMIVDYGRGIMAVYAHNDALHRQVGEWVEKNDILTEAGSTGWVDDVRLYFEIRDQGKSVNPARWCKKSR